MKLHKFAVVGCAAFLAACMHDDDKKEEVVIPPPAPTFSASATFEIDLSGKQQVPANMSMQMGTATIELDESLRGGFPLSQ